ncbi:MAG: DUF4160 domain-containing protein [Gammaproteobacteria bacterium]|nr:DUF4160 domain-containing protein [Gammaproteobacteria bacterium]MBU1653645.1 DUF4160 domain-containing protein [Gammaproteobacteria bacterium]MBU1962013.1 DUF4160 domain-containing protein [Gammaproteobacteria bacterium]
MRSTGGDDRNRRDGPLASETRLLVRSDRGAEFSILDGSILSGEIPAAKSRLVQAWIEIHRESLLADWELAVNGQTPFAIDPLR